VAEGTFRFRHGDLRGFGFEVQGDPTACAVHQTN